MNSKLETNYNIPSYKSIILNSKPISQIYFIIIVFLLIVALVLLFTYLKFDLINISSKSGQKLLLVIICFGLFPITCIMLLYSKILQLISRKLMLNNINKALVSPPFETFSVQESEISKVDVMINKNYTETPLNGFIANILALFALFISIYSLSRITDLSENTFFNIVGFLLFMYIFMFYTYFQRRFYLPKYYAAQLFHDRQYNVVSNNVE